MSVVRIQEIENPKSVVMKYICKRLGLNLRPGEPVFHEEDRVWSVPIKAVVPSKVSRRDGFSKTFYYTFNVGDFKLDEEYHIIQKPGALQLDEMLFSQWNDLNEVIQKEILQYARERWGKLTHVRTFLRPVYTIVIAFLDRKRVGVSEFGYESKKWFELLELSGYIESITDDEFKSTNMLNALDQKLSQEGSQSDFDVADLVAGNIYATDFQRIRDDFHIHAPTIYVDTAQLYYADAVNFKEIVPIQQDELFLKYRQVGSRIAYREAMSQKGYSFATVVSELIAVGLLHRQEEGDIVGDQKLFDHLVQFRDQISPSSELISE
jgi:hypothetical protein